MGRSNNGGYDSGLERDNGVLLQNALRKGKIKEYWYNDGPCKIEWTKVIRDGKCAKCGSNKIHSHHNYTADFAFTTLSDKLRIIECKGHYLAGKGETRAKHQRIKKLYPDMDLRFVFNNKNAKISRASSTTNAEWCKRQGFECESKLIPQRWFNE